VKIVGEIFNKNYRVYGKGRLQAELRKQVITLSRHQIDRIMATNGYRLNTREIDGLIFWVLKSVDIPISY
jgi:hypothetical protein